MRILILQDDFPPRHAGGAGIVAYNLAKEFVRAGHTVRVVTTVRDKTSVGQITFEGLDVVHLYSDYHERWRGYRSLYNRAVISQIRTILREFEPDTVHAHNIHYHLSYYALVLAKRSGARVVLTTHDVMSFNYTKLTGLTDPGDLSVPETFNYRISSLRQLREQRLRYNPFRNFLIRRILARYVDRIAAVSQALEQALKDNGIGNVAVVHNCIDVNAWSEPAELIAQFKGARGIGGSAILFAGRLSGEKGGYKIIEALQNISKSVPDAQILVVGQKDAYAKRMIADAEQRGVAKGLVFTGWISGAELRAAYNAASVVAVPSLCFDSFPTMNLEASACHKPVVATCFGGSREIIEDGVSGYIVNPFDVPTMAGKLTDLLVDKEKSARFGQAGFERVVKEFTLPQQAQEYERLFKRD